MKIGVISFAHLHAHSYATYLNEHPEVEFSAIWDADATRGQEMADQYDTAFYADLDLFLQTDLDAVVVCSENVHHREHVLKAASYQKHVLCEKPIATEIKDAKEMIEACEENNVILQVAFPVRFATPIERVADAVRSGRIGKVLAVNATNHGQMPGGWFVDEALSGGGSAMDHIVHIMDVLRWMLKDEVKSVYAEYDTHFHVIDVEDSGSVMLELESGVIVSIDPSWSRPTTFPNWGDVTMEVVGTEGTLYVDAFKQHSLLYNDTSGKVEQQTWADDMDQRLVNDFIDCVQTKRKPFISGEDGLRTLEVVKASYAANINKQTVQLVRTEL